MSKLRVQGYGYTILWDSEKFDYPVLYDYERQIRIILSKNNILKEYHKLKNYELPLAILDHYNAKFIVIDIKNGTFVFNNVRIEYNDVEDVVDVSMLKDYQLQLVNELVNRKKGFLVLDTGLGKTLTILKTLEYLSKKDGIKNVLVVVPNKTLIQEWYKEQEKWGIWNINLIVVNSQKLLKLLEDKEIKIRRPLIELGNLEDVGRFLNKYFSYSVSTNKKTGKLKIKIGGSYKLYKFEDIKSYKEYTINLNNPNIDALIIDEVHEIAKYSGSPKKISKVLKIISKVSKYLYVLTATPIVNDLLSDGYSYLILFDVKNRTIFKEKGLDKDYRRKAMLYILKNLILYIPIKKELKSNEKIIYVKTNTCCIFEFLSSLRRFAKTLQRYKHANRIPSTEYFRFFKALQDYINKNFRNWYGVSRNGDFGDANHPKLLKLLEILEKHPNDKIVIFTFHLSVSRYLKKHIMMKFERPVFVLTGENSNKAKQILKEFKNTDNGILILSIKAGGLGINLEDVKVAIFYEYWWTWVSIKQARDRILRITSKDKEKIIYYLVSYYFDDSSNIITKPLDKYITLDSWMVTLILEKKMMLEDLLDVKNTFMKALTQDIQNIQW